MQKFQDKSIEQSSLKKSVKEVAIQELQSTRSEMLIRRRYTFMTQKTRDSAGTSFVKGAPRQFKNKSAEDYETLYDKL